MPSYNELRNYRNIGKKLYDNNTEDFYSYNST